MCSDIVSVVVTVQALNLALYLAEQFSVLQLYNITIQLEKKKRINFNVKWYNFSAKSFMAERSITLLQRVIIYTNKQKSVRLKLITYYLFIYCSMLIYTTGANF